MIVSTASVARTAKAPGLIRDRSTGIARRAAIAKTTAPSLADPLTR